MRALGILISIAALLAVPAMASPSTDKADGTITYHKDIEPIFQRNCQSCHRPEGAAYGGMIAPMPLTTYEEVRPWAKAAAKKVQSREMPPWFASEEFHGLFTTERTLSEEEIATVVEWAKTGAAKGDIADAPPPVEFSDYEGWTIGKPDLVLNLEEPFWIDDDVRDLNISLKAEALTEEMLPEARWIEAVEFRPGSGVVHHIIGSSRSASAEEPGATGMIGGIAPGTEPMRLPEGFGRQLVPGTQVWLQMHYNKEPGEGSGFYDQSEIGFIFADEDEVVREVKYDPIGNLTFEIPPGQERWKVGAAMLFPVETDILALWPHGHLRAVSARYEAFYPDGSKELLLDVPNYDQEWQTTYQYKEPKTIPAGTRVQVTMWFNNTEERARARGFDHTRGVINGTATTDEMMLGFINYAPSQKIDQMQQLLGIAPPSHNESGGGR